MRVLFTMWPATAHLNAAVPLATALSSAGHEVVVACHPEITEQVIAASLDAVTLQGAEDAPRPETVADFIIGDEERARYDDALALPDDGREPWDFFAHYLFAALRIFHDHRAVTTRPAPVVDDLVEFARSWGPDVVVWDPCWPSGGVAAKACGATSARLLWGPDYFAWTHDRFRERSADLPDGVEDPLVEVVRPMAERFELKIDESMLTGDWTIDPNPAELRLDTGRPTIPLRPVAHTGAGEIPGWLRGEPALPRVVFTMGTAQRAYERDNATLIAVILEALGGMDVEVVATLNADQLEGQVVPDNVTTVEYVSLKHLLPTCSAIVHHGGGGTYVATVPFGVPQVVLADDSSVAVGESGIWGRRVTGYGAGDHLDYRELSLSDIRGRLEAVVFDPAFRRGAADLRTDWRSVPSPAALVARLEELVAQRATSSSTRSTSAARDGARFVRSSSSAARAV